MMRQYTCMLMVVVGSLVAWGPHAGAASEESIERWMAFWEHACGVGDSASIKEAFHGMEADACDLAVESFVNNIGRDTSRALARRRSLAVLRSLGGTALPRLQARFSEMSMIGPDEFWLLRLWCAEQTNAAVLVWVVQVGLTAKTQASAERDAPADAIMAGSDAGDTGGRRTPTPGERAMDLGVARVQEARLAFGAHPEPTALPAFRAWWASNSADLVWSDIDQQFRLRDGPRGTGGATP